MTNLLNTTAMLHIVCGAIAIGSFGFSVLIWWLDGAWHYSAMPTEGVVRVGFLGFGGLSTLLMARWLEHWGQS
jgi:hypothetical protein